MIANFKQQRSRPGVAACLGNQKAQQGRQLQHIEDSELSAVDLLLPLNAYLKPDAYHKPGEQGVPAQAASDLYKCASEASKQNQKQAEHSRSNDYRAGPLDTVCQGVAAAVGEGRL